MHFESSELRGPNNIIFVPFTLPVTLMDKRQITYFAEDDFWGQILGGAAQRPCATLHPLRKPEISYLKTKSRMNFFVGV